ncbi:hypothetical protein ACPF64_17520 [Acinetobacter sp. KB005]|uniref:hypothetical protein n=1 Tax=Acinetobacter sp. KB005 TaxID=3416667 RepID=UPI003CEE272D
MPSLIGLAVIDMGFRAVGGIMGLLNLIKEDETYKYISLKEAINLLAEKTTSNIYEVAVYLLNKSVESYIDCYIRGIDHKIHVSSAGRYDGSGWNGENYAFDILKRIIKNGDGQAPSSIHNFSTYNKECEEVFWNRTDFFNLDGIKSLNLLGSEEVTKDRQQLYIWDQKYLTIQENDVPHFELFEDQFIYGFEFGIINESEIPHELWDYEEQTKKYPLYYKNDTFTATEAACLISGYDPTLIGHKANKVVWRKENPVFDKAINFIYSAVRGDLFEEVSSGLFIIKSAQLKDFLKSKKIVIEGFNDVEEDSFRNDEIIYVDNNDLEMLIKENEQLHDNLAKFEEIRMIALNAQNEVVSLTEENQELERNVSNLKNALLWIEHEKYELEAEVKILQEKIEKEGQINQIDKCDQLIHPSLNKNTASFAPELLIAIEAWEAKYLHNEYPYQEHTPAITNILKKRNITQVNLVKRICAITNPKK